MNKETTFRNLKIGNTVYKTIFSHKTKTVKTEPLIVTEITKHNPRYNGATKLVKFNNGELLDIKPSLYVIQSGDILERTIIIYTTNLITTNNYINNYVSEHPNFTV